LTEPRNSRSPVYNFRGQTAVVTGAAQGIGRTVAERLAASGAFVVVADQQEKLAAAAAEHICAGIGRAVAYEVDVTDEVAVGELIRFAATNSGRFSVLVNNAGISTTGLLDEVTLADWRRVIDVNLTGPFITSKAALPYLRRAGGKIVNISSVAGKRISANMAASYTASKAGVLALTRHLAYESAPWRVNVNAVCPGPVEAPMMYREVPPDAIARMVAGVPRGRLSTPDDLADAVLFLASPAADMITGVALDVDGGALLGWIDIAEYLARHGIDAGSAQASDPECAELAPVEERGHVL